MTDAEPTRLTHEGAGDASAVGRLVGPDAAPTTGERTLPVSAARGFTVEQIVSGRVEGPIDYRQDHDEWVVVLAGGALLAVGGVEHAMAPGDWCLLPAGSAHTLVRVDPGTSWLAVRGVDSGAEADRSSR